MDLMRADEWLVAHGLAPTRSQAKDIIRRQNAFLAGKAIKKAGQMLAPDAEVTISEPHHYVGRGAQKLIAGLEAFPLNLQNRIAVDLGASTGGFTQVLLERGCKLVFAVDVGHDQLAPSIKSDPRVINMEGINARHPLGLKPKPDLVVVDLSFISLRLIWPTLKALIGEDGDGIVLVKPQFEAGPGGVNRRGVVQQPQRAKAILKALLQWGQTMGLSAWDVIDSPIQGKKGNREFLVHLRPFPGEKTLAELMKNLN